VVQEAFLRAYQKLEQFAEKANFGTWVYRIAANYAIDRMRQRKSEDSQRAPAAARRRAPYAAACSSGASAAPAGPA
jgi:RNA polymerase sigma-70 factor (ECF subfamily)